MDLSKTIDIGSLLKFTAVLVAVVGTFVWMQADIQNLNQEQARLDQKQAQIRTELRSNFVTREQLDYIVIQRLERLEERMDRRFDELKEAIENDI